MGSAGWDLLFWIVALVALFALFRWLQGRKKDKD
jgi:hypothetical protein